MAQPRGFPSAPLSRCRFRTVPKGVNSEKRSSSLHMVGTCAAQALQPLSKPCVRRCRRWLAAGGALNRPGSAIKDQLPLQRQQLVQTARACARAWPTNSRGSEATGSAMAPAWDAAV